MEEESEDEVEQLPGSRRGNYMLCGARVSHGGMASGVKAGVDAASQQRRQARLFALKSHEHGTRRQSKITSSR